MINVKELRTIFDFIMYNGIVRFFIDLIGIIGFILTVVTLVRTAKIQKAISSAKEKENFRLKADSYKTNLNRAISEFGKNPKRISVRIIRQINSDLNSMKITSNIFTDEELNIIAKLCDDVNELYKKVIAQKETDVDAVALIASQITQVISVIDKELQ